MRARAEREADDAPLVPDEVARAARAPRVDVVPRAVMLHAPHVLASTIETDYEVMLPAAACCWDGTIATTKLKHKAKGIQCYSY